MSKAMFGTVNIMVAMVVAIMIASAGIAIAGHRVSIGDRVFVADDAGVTVSLHDVKDVRCLPQINVAKGHIDITGAGMDCRRNR